MKNQKENPRKPFYVFYGAIFTGIASYLVSIINNYRCLKYFDYIRLSFGNKNTYYNMLSLISILSIIAVIILFIYLLNVYSKTRPGKRICVNILSTLISIAIIVLQIIGVIESTKMNVKTPIYHNFVNSSDDFRQYYQTYFENKTTYNVPEVESKMLPDEDFYIDFTTHNGLEYEWHSIPQCAIDWERSNIQGNDSCLYNLVEVKCIGKWSAKHLKNYWCSLHEEYQIQKDALFNKTSNEKIRIRAIFQRNDKHARQYTLFYSVNIYLICMEVFAVIVFFVTNKIYLFFFLVIENTIF